METRERVRRLVEFAGPDGITGFDIGEICGLGTWRLYRALAALEHGGLLCSDFDDSMPYPRHRRYFLPYYNRKAA